MPSPISPAASPVLPYPSMLPEPGTYTASGQGCREPLGSWRRGFLTCSSFSRLFPQWGGVGRTASTEGSKGPSVAWELWDRTRVQSGLEWREVCVCVGVHVCVPEQSGEAVHSQASFILAGSPCGHLPPNPQVPQFCHSTLPDPPPSPRMEVQ